jgi:DNA-directed RNA polymerase subunit beta
MNVGQILETHLGWGARELGRQIHEMVESKFSADKIKARLVEVYDGDESFTKMVKSLSAEEAVSLAGKVRGGIFFGTPVFDGAAESQIKGALDKAHLSLSGQAILFDGRSGEPFDHNVTVGVMYMLKLHHLVDDKVHARSTGPYSLITQQPLGGKARFGGQRFGEMEVWALEAYGAAYILQELLTVKSDDVEGRTKIYESMVKGENTLEAGTPASFDVLTNEIRGLALNMQLEKRRV